MKIGDIVISRYNRDLFYILTEILSSDKVTMRSILDSRAGTNGFVFDSSVTIECSKQNIELYDKKEMISRIISSISKEITHVKSLLMLLREITNDT